MESQHLDFSHVLMSSIHDIKNSLLLFQSTLDYLDGEQQDCVDDEARSAMSRLQYETQRINNSLVQVLSLYKLDQSMVHLQAQHHSVCLFLRDQLLANRPTAEHLGIAMTLDCADDLEWQFDRKLMDGIIGTILNNALRYSKQAIHLSAAVEGDYLAIHVRDDGDGYPDSMLADGNEAATDINFNSGSTGLGLFFAARIVAMHEYHGLRGYTRIANDGERGGGHFTAYIPGPVLNDLADLLSSN